MIPEFVTAQDILKTPSTPEEALLNARELHGGQDSLYIVISVTTRALYGISNTGIRFGGKQSVYNSILFGPGVAKS